MPTQIARISPFVSCIVRREIKYVIKYCQSLDHKKKIHNFFFFSILAVSSSGVCPVSPDPGGCEFPTYGLSGNSNVSVQQCTNRGLHHLSYWRLYCCRSLVWHGHWWRGLDGENISMFCSMLVSLFHGCVIPLYYAENVYRMHWGTWKCVKRPIHSFLKMWFQECERFGWKDHHNVWIFVNKQFLGWISMDVFTIHN